MLRKFILLLIVLAGCGPDKVEIRASLPDWDGVETPVPNLAFVVLPYDRDSILKTLESTAAAPRPHTQKLDSLFAIWREPFSRYSRASYQAREITDSLAVLRRRLDSLPRSAPEYPGLYGAFAALSDCLNVTKAHGEPARLELDRLRRRVIPAVDSLRREVTAWENSTFRQYESIVSGLTTTRDPIADTTAADGHVEIRLKPGKWWVYAWTWDPADPYREWYWNVPVNGDSVVLDARSGKRRVKY